MDAEEFRIRGKEMVDYVADYLENIRERRPLSDVTPGYLHQLIPNEAPQDGEKWEDIFQDIERVIMPGVTHWHSPRFFSYFPTGNSYPAICADILSDAIGCIGFSWVASPACTELEVVMMDWLAGMMNLPSAFMSGGKGGGVIHGTASEATLVALFSARSRALRRLKEKDADVNEADVLCRLVIYASDQAHSSVERACLLAHVKFHAVRSDDNNVMTGEALERAIKEDRKRGLLPFFCVATLGTTSSCVFDKLQEVGPVCEGEALWLHVDAAYAGSAFVCPEFQPYMEGVELVDSFNFNPHKWLLVNFDCSAMWFKDTSDVIDSFNVDPPYLKHKHQDAMPDYRHWQIPLGRRFRSLKLWFVMRMYGVKGLQNHIRTHVRLAHEFEAMVLSDDRFEIVQEVTLGLVCFRLKSSNEENQLLLKKIDEDGRIHLVASEIKGVYFLRLAVCASSCESKDIEFAWKSILSVVKTIKEPRSCMNGF